MEGSGWDNWLLCRPCVRDWVAWSCPSYTLQMCDGTNLECPADRVQMDTTFVCRAANGTCDVAEVSWPFGCSVAWAMVAARRNGASTTCAVETEGAVRCSLRDRDRVPHEQDCCIRRRCDLKRPGWRQSSCVQDQAAVAVGQRQQPTTSPTPPCSSALMSAITRLNPQG